MIDPALASFALHLAGLAALVIVALGWHGADKRRRAWRKRAELAERRLRQRQRRDARRGGLLR